jgi:hypothetical protein
VNTFSELVTSTSDQLAKRGQRILSVLREIDPSSIDMGRTFSKQYEQDQLVSIKVFSVNDMCCPVAVVIGTGASDGIVYFYYDDSGAILDEKVITEAETESIRDSIRHHLAADVFEEKTFVKGELVRVEHKFTYPLEGRLGLFPFLSVFKHRWPWSRKMVVRKEYKAWPLLS